HTHTHTHTHTAHSRAPPRGPQIQLSVELCHDWSLHVPILPRETTHPHTHTHTHPTPHTHPHTHTHTLFSLPHSFNLVYISQPAALMQTSRQTTVCFSHIARREREREREIWRDGEVEERDIE